MICRFRKDLSSYYHIGTGLRRLRRGLQGPERGLGQVSPERGWHRGSEFWTPYRLELADLAIFLPDNQESDSQGCDREVYIKMLQLSVLVASVQGKAFLKQRGVLKP